MPPKKKAETNAAGTTNPDDVETVTEQFPALADAPDEEIAQRSPDVHKDSSSVHVKDYVVLKREFDDATATKDGEKEFHLRQVEQARQALLNLGLRPTGDGKFKGSDEYGDGKNVVLHYEVPVVPAVIATDPDVAHAYVTLDDQHAKRDPATDRVVEN